METKSSFASPERSSDKEITSKNLLLQSNELICRIFDAVNKVGAILDENRQIIYANNEFLSAMGFDSLEALLGKRPGEAISCIFSEGAYKGCGTNEACSVCGAVNAILESQATGKKVVKETRIRSKVGGKESNWDLRVTSVPIEFSGHTFYVFTIEDISSENRKMALERIFFHDILNIAGSLGGLLAILKEETDPDTIRDIINNSEETSNNLLEEIIHQRQLISAENGDLEIKPESLNTLEVLKSVTTRIKYIEAAERKNLIIDGDSADLQFRCDKNIIHRVLINLLKNALEATSQGGVVKVGCYHKEGKLMFSVWNKGVIPADIQMQIFQRSFSTKGTGRGLGTYSIRLLTERYLNGTVSFVSNEHENTRFTIALAH